MSPPPARSRASVKDWGLSTNEGEAQVASKKIKATAEALRRDMAPRSRVYSFSET